MIHNDPQIWIGLDAQLGPRLLYTPPPAVRPSRWVRFWSWLRLPVSALWRR